MDVYLLSNPLFWRRDQNDNFHVRFVARLQGGKNDCRKMAASLFSFSFLRPYVVLLQRYWDLRVALSVNC